MKKLETNSESYLKGILKVSHKASSFSLDISKFPSASSLTRSCETRMFFVLRVIKSPLSLYLPQPREASSMWVRVNNTEVSSLSSVSESNSFSCLLREAIDFCETLSFCWSFEAKNRRQAILTRTPLMPTAGIKAKFWGQYSRIKNGEIKENKIQNPIINFPSCSIMSKSLFKAFPKISIIRSFQGMVGRWLPFCGEREVINMITLIISKSPMPRLARR